MKKEICLVTGGTGFIGSHMVELLVKKGYRVKATSLTSAKRHSRNVEIIKADLTKKNDVKKLFKDNTDIIFNSVGTFDFGLSYEKLYKTNVVTAKNLCEAALSSNIKSFVHWSSVGVYAKPQAKKIKEDHPKKPHNAYGKTKLESEEIVLKYREENGLPVTIIRPALVYGPKSRYGHATFIAFLLLMREKLKTNKLPVPKGGDLLSFVNVYDVVNAALFLSKKKQAIGEAYNIVDDKPLSMERFVLSLMKPLKLQPSSRIPLNKLEEFFIKMFASIAPNFVLNKINRRLGEDWKEVIKKYKLKAEIDLKLDKGWLDYFGSDFWYDNSKLKKLGYTFKYPDFRKGIAETTKWYESDGWIPPIR